MQLLLIKIILRDLDSHIQIEKRPCVDLNHQPFGQQPAIFYITLKDPCVRMQLLLIKIDPSGFPFTHQNRKASLGGFESPTLS